MSTLDLVLISIVLAVALCEDTSLKVPAKAQKNRSLRLQVAHSWLKAAHDHRLLAFQVCVDVMQDKILPSIKALLGRRPSPYGKKERSLNRKKAQTILNEASAGCVCRRVQNSSKPAAQSFSQQVSPFSPRKARNKISHPKMASP